MSLPPWIEPKITVGNIIATLMFIVTVAAGYTNLQQTAAAAGEAAAIAAAAIPPLRERVLTIENRIDAGQRQREQFQQETAQTLSELRAQNLAILQAIARLEARVDSR